MRTKPRRRRRAWAVPAAGRRIGSPRRSPSGHGFSGSGVASQIFTVPSTAPRSDLPPRVVPWFCLTRRGLHLRSTMLGGGRVARSSPHARGYHDQANPSFGADTSCGAGALRRRGMGLAGSGGATALPRTMGRRLRAAHSGSWPRGTSSPRPGCPTRAGSGPSPGPLPPGRGRRVAPAHRRSQR